MTDRKSAATDDARVCLLLGAGGRLGRNFCRYLGTRYRIAAVYRTAGDADAVRRQERVIDPLVPDRPPPEPRTYFYPIVADLADPYSAKRVAELALAAFGHIDLVVNAAVHYDLGPGTSTEFLERLPYQLVINVVRPLQVAVEVYRQSWQATPEENRRNRRNVINLSSVAAFNLYPDSGRLGYSACKAALTMASRHLASELEPAGIRVNALAPNTFPGIVSVQQVLAALCDLDSGSTTGEVRVVDRDPTDSIRREETKKKGDSAPCRTGP
ncbi:oxidoreductase, SDR family [Streptomyces laurentii]|uniref:Oxidoreductase, SDR family n=1 Tax=Streptomyces laurentii TaxID=39478 RepID=A0A169N967_STRLU|nr:oxidoreductase, SDR family [Streptomyces laurentii]